MKTSPEKINTHGNIARPVQQMTGKKVLAGVLLLVLALMWIRVFVGKSDGPKAAEAAVKTTDKAKKPQVKEAKFKRVKLPFEFGRHDRLTTDMFASRGMDIGENSRANAENEQKIKSQKDAADKLAKKIELDAIILGVDKVSHQAFINGKIQVQGDILEVKLNDNTYELKVVEIFHNKVILKWNEFTISVRMANIDK